MTVGAPWAPRLGNAGLAVVDLPLTAALYVIAAQLATPHQRWFIFLGSAAYLVLGVALPAFAAIRLKGVGDARRLRRALLVSLGLNLVVLPIGIAALAM